MRAPARAPAGGHGYLHEPHHATALSRSDVCRLPLFSGRIGNHAPVAQLDSECQATNLEVGGSSPPGRANPLAIEMNDPGTLLIIALSTLLTGFVVGVAWRGRALHKETARRIGAEAQATRVTGLETTLQQRDQELQQAREMQARREEQAKSAQQQLQLLEEARHRLTDTFKSLSADTLRANNETFMQQARGAFEQYQKPIQASLNQAQQYLKDVELRREGVHKGLEQQVKNLLHQGELLRTETHGLRNALRSPTVAGRWGELQLKRVVELAGLQEHCDFSVQATAQSGQRPDLVVHLPGRGQVIVDAKTPIADYLQASDASSEEQRQQLLSSYTSTVRRHLRELSGKAYWEQFQPAPAFVILYLPGEAFYQAAISKDPELVATAAGLRVLPAGPITLLALLHTVALGWRDQQFTENAEQVRQLGQQIYDRLGVLINHWNKVGNNLHKVVENYNHAASSMASRVLPSARKINELGGISTGKELPAVKLLDIAPRIDNPVPPDD